MMQVLEDRQALISDTFLIGGTNTEDLARAYGLVTGQVQLIQEIVSCELIQEELDNDETFTN